MSIVLLLTGRTWTTMEKENAKVATRLRRQNLEILVKVQNIKDYTEMD